MSHKKQNIQTYLYDTAIQKPILKCSICNGESILSMYAGIRLRASTKDDFL